MTLTDVLVSEAEAVYAGTERLFRRLTDDDLAWKPEAGGNWMTVSELLMHCAAFGCGRAIEGFVTGRWEPEDAPAARHVPPAEQLPGVDTVAHALELLAADRHLAIRCIRAVPEADLLTRGVAAPWGGPERPLLQHLLQMLAHLAQHKGQLFYYLKLMGHDVGTGDLWGTPADGAERVARSG